MRIYEGGMTYYLTALDAGVAPVEAALVGAGHVFTMTPTTVVWPGGKQPGVEFTVFVKGAQQRAPMDLIHSLIESGVWLLYRKADATVPR